MAARTRNVRGAKGGTVTVNAGVGRSASSEQQGRYLTKRMKARR